MSDETIKTYVEYIFPGALFSETERKEVKERNPKKTAQHAPKGAFAFRFYDQSSKNTTIDGEKTVVYGKQKNISPTYYPGGIKFSLPEIKAMGKSHDILASNMECNRWPVVVKTRRGNFQPLENTDVIL